MQLFWLGYSRAGFLPGSSSWAAAAGCNVGRIFLHLICHHPHLASSLLCCPSDICRGAPSLLAHPAPWGQSPCAAPGTSGFVNSALHVSYSQRDMNSWATLLEMPLQGHRTSCSSAPGGPCHRRCPLPTPLPCSRCPGQQSRAKAIVQCRDPLCFIYMRHHLFYKLDYNLKWNTQGNIY